jgi:D-sedoheptulose 7-phosphate isomerase
MSATPETAVSAERVEQRLATRVAEGERFFSAEARRLSELCHLMAERFARGGRLLATGSTPQARSDARHVAVEFVHPVIVGKRALPAMALSAEGGPIDPQVALVAEPEDMLMSFDGVGLELARERGCLTIAFEESGAEWELVPQVEDPFVCQEVA